jgi:hypothetical protein
MTDPKFETRAELEAWVEGYHRVAVAWIKHGFPNRAVPWIDFIRRVTLAHQHLERTSDER